MSESFFIDDDLAGAGEFIEGQTSLGTRMTLAAGSVSALRARWPNVAPAGTTLARLYKADGTLVGSAAVFDATTLDSWNIATFASPIAVEAGDYVAVYVTPNRYVARTGFFSGGSITRGNITAHEGRFAGGDAFPSSTSTASFFADVVWAADSTAIPVTDSGTESETATAAIAAATVDSATLAETAAPVVAGTTTDTGTLAEAGTVATASAVTDDATVTDTAAATVAVDWLDSATLAELQALAVAAALADLAALAETAATAVTGSVADTGTLAEVIVIDIPGQSRPATAEHLSGPQRAAHYSGPQRAAAYRG